MQTLIGISAPNTQRTRAIIHLLREQLQLLHICMRQPVVKALAALLEIEPHDLVRHTEPHRHYKRWGKNLAELEESLSQLVHQGNPLCFTDYTEHQMKKNADNIKPQLFSGYLITAIGTEAEAAWLRQQGGTLLHIYDYTLAYYGNYLDEHDTDHSIVCGNDCEAALANFIANIEDAKEAA